MRKYTHNNFRCQEVWRSDHGLHPRTTARTNAKIGQLHMTGGRDKNVAGLDVTMNKRMLMHYVYVQAFFFKKEKSSFRNDGLCS